MFEFNIEAAKVAGLLDPTPFTTVDGSGVSWNFILSKFPSMQGLEIMAEIPMTGIMQLNPKAITKDAALKMLPFVAVELPNGIIQRLESAALIDNHTGDWEAVVKIMVAMAGKNCSFFRDGRISDFLNDFALKSLPKILKTWTELLGQSSRTDMQP